MYRAARRTLIAAVLLQACTAPDPESPVADDGTRVVSSPESGVVTADWSIDPEPLVEIGHAEGDSAYLFSTITGLERLHDGRILVVDMVSRELRFFDQSGLHLGSAGGTGEGPGEFMRPRLLNQLSDDSLLVWDDDLRRLSRLDTNGDLIEILDTSVSESPVPPRPWTVFEDGVLVTSFPAENPISTPEDGQILQDTFHLWTVEPGSGVRSRLADRPAARWQYIDHPTRPEMMLIPFTTTPRFDVSRSHVFISFGTHPGVQVLDRNGDVVREMWVDRPDRPVRAENIDAVSELRRRDLDPADQPLARRRLENLTYPERMPKYDRLFRSEDGRVWARHFLAEGDPVPTWDLFTDTGTFLGTLDTPAGLEVYEIGPDWILGVNFGELDIPVVQLYALRTD